MKIGERVCHYLIEEGDFKEVFSGVALGLVFDLGLRNKNFLGKENINWKRDFFLDFFVDGEGLEDLLFDGEGLNLMKIRIIKANKNNKKEKEGVRIRRKNIFLGKWRFNW